VDLPLPDKPIITNISPFFTSKDTLSAPTVVPKCLNIYFLLLQAFNNFNAFPMPGPNILVTFFTSNIFSMF
jgi:hypothetical protein